MKIEVLAIGKTHSACFREGIGDYLKRLTHYVQCRIVELPDVKSGANDAARQKEAEAKAMLLYIEPSDRVILLDEHGSEPTSREFSGLVQRLMASGAKRAVFVIGGPYGFAEPMYARADMKISLSRMTFPHDMVRLVFAEQLYRAFTIMRNEPYHHD